LILVSIAGVTQDSDAWNNKAAVLGQLDKLDEAITAYKKAIEVNSQDSIAWNNKVLTLKN
jgi:Flp pilus assembly protein TadD